MDAMIALFVTQVIDFSTYSRVLGIGIGEMREIRGMGENRKSFQFTLL
jgi:hypothetical protein